MYTTTIIIICAAGLGLLSACGDDTSSTGTMNAMAGTTGGGGSSGSSTGGVGGAGNGGSGGGGPVLMISCGTAMCEIPPAGAGFVKPCCLDEAMSSCGVMSSFTQNKCVGMGEPDAQCPSIMIAGAMVPGCCTPEGMCGANAEAIGMGCVNFGSAMGTGGMGMGMGMGTGGLGIELPPEQACVPGGAPDAAVPSEDDGGV